MIILHHNKDMDGWASGAICRMKYPKAKLVGWDYAEPIPDFAQFKGKNVIMIDITFSLEKCLELGAIVKSLVILDHHISFKKQVDNFSGSLNFKYVYEDQTAACEIGWKYLFPTKPVPYAVTLIGRYDTWRKNEGDWIRETLPFKYFMYGLCNSAESFPDHILSGQLNIDYFLKIGEKIMGYVETMDETTAKNYAYETTAYGLRALVINTPYFSNEVVKTQYDPQKHDIMVGYCYTGTMWSVSLRSTTEIDASAIASARGGGGHKQAAGFEVKSFDDILK